MIPVDKQLHLLAGGGFNPDGSPVTLFEGHKFYKYTNGAFAVQAPDLCFKTW